MSSDRRQTVLVVLGAIFLSNALIAELVGGKLFQFPFLGLHLTLSAGALLWPVVFVTSDLINEYFGRAGVKRLSLLGAAMIAYAFVAIWVCGLPAAAPFSPVSDAAFLAVFRQSRWIIVGSIVAFLVAQLLDVSVFWALRRLTGRRQLWLRATGSTVVSQIVDTFIVGFIGLHLPYRLYGPGQGVDFETYLRSAASGYLFKFVVAVAATPLLYLGHAAIDGWMGHEEADELIASAARPETAAAPEAEPEAS
jgi:queuosine precursor transporter